MVCVPDGRQSGCLLSLGISDFPTHQTSVTTVDQPGLDPFLYWQEFPPLDPLKPLVTREACRMMVPRSCLSAAVSLEPQEHLNRAVTGSQLSMLPAVWTFTQPGCTTDHCSPNPHFNMTSPYHPPESIWCRNILRLLSGLILECF